MQVQVQTQEDEEEVKEEVEVGTNVLMYFGFQFLVLTNLCHVIWKSHHTETTQIVCPMILT